MAADPDETAEQQEHTVADPEEFNQTERLRVINRVREQAGEAFEVTMSQLRTESEFDEADRRQILRAAVMRYITNIEWLVHKAEDYERLQTADLGEVVLEPPANLVRLAKEQTGDYPRVIGSPDLEPKVWQINGFNDYLTAPQSFSATWKLSVDKRHAGPSAMSETRSVFMPAHISFNAYRLANQFLSEQGMDVDISEEQHRAVVDDDVIEEVEQWRKENL